MKAEASEVTGMMVEAKALCVSVRASQGETHSEWMAWPPSPSSSICDAADRVKDGTYKTGYQCAHAWSSRAPCCPPCHRKSVYCWTDLLPSVRRRLFDIESSHLPCQGCRRVKHVAKMCKPLIIDWMLQVELIASSQ